MQRVRIRERVANCVHRVTLVPNERIAGSVKTNKPPPRKRGSIVVSDNHRRRVAAPLLPLFFIDVTSREVFFAGITANPTGTWTTQAARNLFLRHSDRLTDAQALVRDRGSQFIDSFEEIFRTESLKILKTPVRTPVANTFAERWIGTLRRELLDRTIIWNQHQLERLVVDYIAHYNQHRPHRSLDQQPPRPADVDEATSAPQPTLRVIRTSRCNGLINEYRHAA